MLTDGPISRINFCTIPEQEIGADQPVYGLYDMEFDEKLKPYIDNLTAARGLIDCPQATRLAITTPAASILIIFFIPFVLFQAAKLPQKS